MRFHIALNMAGAVSAGAYTAGVLDFLIEALDAWYAEKENQQRQFGEDRSKWNIPSHEVVVDVMSGASAGGMCSAIGSIALKETFEHIRATGPAPDVPRNRLYKSWVDMIDIVPLLGKEDLRNGQGPVRSLLDSSTIDGIAQTQLKPDPAQAVKRAWVAGNLGVILTMSNLRGIPYSVDEANEGSFEERMSYHADRIEFAVADSGAADTANAYALNYSEIGHSNWQTLATAAMATGAFPVMLATRVLDRKRSDYETRLWNVDNETPADGQCQNLQAVQPAWDGDVVPSTFQNPYVDGGVTNNNPFECARQYLLSSAGNVAHNPREAERANAAVISIAPFPGQENFQPGYQAEDQTHLENVVGALIGVLINQSRFLGEELILTKDPDVKSRFAISPSDENAGSAPALLSSPLSAFGGFIDRKFRDHDYQLGRRNCQKFLSDYFTLPEDNPIIASGLSGQPGFGVKKDNRYWYPIIPLMPAVAEPVPALNRADYYTSEARLDQVAAAATARLKAVLEGLANSPGAKHGLWEFLIKAGFDLGGASKVKSFILEKLKDGLKGQIANP